MTNGIVLYIAADLRGDYAVANEIGDEYGGHLGKSEYHYHATIEHPYTIGCLVGKASVSSGPSTE